MKHLLNNLSEEEKNNIREQYTGGIRIDNENFKKLTNSKLGDVRPLTEQKSDFSYDKQSNAVLRGANVRSEKDYQQTNQIINTTQQNFMNVDPHTLMTVLSIASLVTPFGPLVGGIIGLVDAAMYYNEGDTKKAGVVAAFSMIPILGKVVSKIPTVKTLGAKGMAALSNKLSLGGKNLTAAEMDIVNAIYKNFDFIKTEINNSLPLLNKVMNTINTYKAGFIKKYGYEQFLAHIKEYLGHKITEHALEDTLKST